MVQVKHPIQTYPIFNFCENFFASLITVLCLLSYLFTFLLSVFVIVHIILVYILFNILGILFLVLDEF
jgi:hypothetical protein